MKYGIVQFRNIKTMLFYLLVGTYDKYGEIARLRENQGKYCKEQP